jgi:uncharacterized phage-associated protein
MRFNLNMDKAVEASLFILNKVQTCTLHTLFKTLYFADKKHLAEYGRPITGDSYIAMKHGPVPSFIYDIIKIVRGDQTYFSVERDFNSDISVVNHKYVGAKRPANTDFLSGSDIECLEAVIEDCRGLSFEVLTSLSHDSAWNNAPYNDEISIMEIATAAGVEIEMLKYIQGNMENQKSYSH